MKIILFLIVLLSISLIPLGISLPNDAQNQINFHYPTSTNVNYSTVNVNNSNCWLGHCTTDGSWLTGIGGGNPFNQVLNTTDDVTFSKGIFGSTHQAILGDDLNTQAGYFFNPSFTTYIARDTEALYSTDGTHDVWLADGTYAINAVGNITTTNDVIANRFYGDGSQLTGISSGGINGTNINVLTINSTSQTINGNLSVGNNNTGQNGNIYATIGTEKVPNFAGGNWTCTGGWVANGVTLATTAVSGSITPNAVTNIVAGVTYKITLTISASSTSLYFDFGGAPTMVTNWGGSGSYTWYVTTLTTAKPAMSMASSGSGTITALSIKPFTDATGDLLVEGDLYLRSNVQTTNGINFIANDSNAAFRFSSGIYSVLLGGQYFRFTGGTSYLDSSFAGDAGFVMRTSKTSALNGLSYNFNSGGLGIGITPTSILHLKAGTSTASASPLKFTSGTNLATPEAGAMEYDGTNYYLTNGSNLRKVIITNDSNLNIVTSGNVTASNFIGNGSRLTSVCLSNGSNCASSGGGNPFDQSLNTTDSVTFATGTFGNTYQAIIGSDLDAQSGYFTGAGGTVYLARDTEAGYFDDGINSVHLADSVYAISFTGGIYSNGYSGLSDCYDSSLGGQVCSDNGIVYSITDDPSDKSFKNDIKNLSLDLTKFNQLKPSEWTWANNFTGKQGQNSTGLIADDLQSVYPSIVKEGQHKEIIGYKNITKVILVNQVPKNITYSELIWNITTYKTIDYAGIIALQTAKIQYLENKIDTICKNNNLKC